MARYMPELKKLMDKRLSLGLNGNRTVEGMLRGYDQFCNVVLDECVEVGAEGDRRSIGTSLIRGNSVLTMQVVAPR